jgi:hypothetical protein
MANEAFLNSVKGKTRDELLASLNANAHARDAAYELQKWVFTFRCVEDIQRQMAALTAAINAASEGSDRLGEQLVSLNRTLARATIVAAIAH